MGQATDESSVPNQLKRIALGRGCKFELGHRFETAKKGRKPETNPVNEFLVNSFDISDMPEKA